MIGPSGPPKVNQLPHFLKSEVSVCQKNNFSTQTKTLWFQATQHLRGGENNKHVHISPAVYHLSLFVATPFPVTEVGRRESYYQWWPSWIRTTGTGCPGGFDHLPNVTQIGTITPLIWTERAKRVWGGRKLKGKECGSSKPTGTAIEVILFNTVVSPSLRCLTVDEDISLECSSYV